MELLFTQTVRERAETRSFRKVLSSRTEKGNSYHFAGFYYIGEDASCFQALTSHCSNGYSYSVESLSVVVKELLRAVEQEKCVLPEFILMEAAGDPVRIRQFCEFLRSHQVLYSIPFIIDASKLSQEQVAVYRKMVRPDEIILPGKRVWSEFQRKVEFLRKMKSGMSAGKVKGVEPARPFKVDSGLATKRAFDLLVTSMALIVLSPLMLVIAIAIKIDSRGPVFYIAKRAGRGYRIFNFYKFRTMHQDADKRIKDLIKHNLYNPELQGPVFFKMTNDPRVTRLGSFLRNTSLDELPQLFNVLLGDMSLVGNRPLPLYEASTLTTDHYAARFLAPAGITGLWQVKKRGNKDMSVEERISIDIDYASKVSFKTDLWIMASTPSALLQKENV